jgi:hypothetical protein
MNTVNDNLQKKIRKIAIWAGILFLTAMVGSLVGGVAFVEPYLSAADPLTAVAENQTQVVIGVLLELINGIAVVGIGVLIYPIFRRHSRISAVGYLALRILEAVFCCLIVVSPLALLAINQATFEPGIGEAIAALTIAQRGAISGLLIPIFFGLSALVFYVTLIKTRLLPRWISIWGLIGAVLILIMNLLLTFQVDLGDLTMAFALPIITNEIFLGFWLITKGFKTEDQNPATKA